MKSFFLILFAILVAFGAPAQHNEPITGSGVIVQTKFTATEFDKIQLTDLAGAAYIQIADSFSVRAEADDNLLRLLSAEVKNGALAVRLKGNKENRLYIERANIKIFITLPVLTSFSQNGNNDSWITGIRGLNFSVNSYGNGNVTISGNCSAVEIVKTGNGDVIAANLLTKTTRVESAGNGDVIINAAKSFAVRVSGNGDVNNKGLGQLEAGSGRSGNGSILSNGKEIH